MSRSFAAAYAIVVAALLVSAGGLSAALTAAQVRLNKLPIHPENNKTFLSLPKELGGWAQLGPDRPALSADVVEALGTTNFITRDYTEKNPRPGAEARSLELHCAYYTGAIDAVPHVPERCFVGAGLELDGGPWLMPLAIDLSRTSFDPDVDAELLGDRVRMGRTKAGVRVHYPLRAEELTLRVSRFNTPDGHRIFSGYFFLANGGAVPSADRVRELAFRLKETHAYYAKIQFTSARAESPEDLAEAASALLNDALPEILERVPDWPRVVEKQNANAQTRD